LHEERVAMNDPICGDSSMTMTFDIDDAAARVANDPLDRALFNMLGRERTHEITVQCVNREKGVSDPGDRYLNQQAETETTT
jgi:hypothetical protein